MGGDRGPLGSALVLLGAFLAFMVALAAVHRLDRETGRRFGYRPLALPNLAFMLIPHGIAVAALAARASGTDPGAYLGLPPGADWALGAVAILAALFMLWVLRGRTSLTIALGATAIMTAAASVLLLSMLFRELAEGGGERGARPGTGDSPADKGHQGDAD
jgi:hypothetical protein